ncbi:S8 family serine peptidase [Halorubrum sp. BOL3-1]|uniref:S8 family serine peptidase n=1 Tax=Halorubrum sp. BOL3-1 TaxID=2497325 RepID=UPI00140A9BAC|nr:S8 family serine peptidase [Halorubrum sp. BOL3-1]
MVRRKTLFATLFAAVMVASMFAPTAGAAAVMDGTGGDAVDAGAADVDSEVQQQTETTAETNQSDRAERKADALDRGTRLAPGADRSGVHPALRSASGETVVVISVERGLDPQTLPADSSAALDAIKDDSDATQQPVVDALETEFDADVRNRFWAGNVVTAEVDLSEVDIRVLAEKIDGVKSVSPNVRYERPDPPATGSDAGAAPANHNGSYTYGLEQINVPEFEDEFDTQGEGATVMIGDNGISNPEEGHPDLEFATEAIVENGTVDEGTLVGGSAGSHGEHTAGTATGAAHPAGDVPRYGVAPEADLLMADVFAGGAFSEDIIASMQWAAENDADVASFSLGFPSSTGLSTFQPAYVETIQDVNAAGTVAVVSAGNSGSGDGGGPVTSPATNFRSAAIGASNSAGTIAAFSSGDVITDDDVEIVGPENGTLPDTFPHRYVQPDVSAPGANVLSSGPLGGDVGDDNATYSTASGTSMAAPHYAGAVALLQSATDEELSPGLIQAALAETAEKPDNEFPSADGRDIRYGTGIIDVNAAAQALNETQTVEGTVTDNATGDAVVGATVATDAGALTTTDENGSYVLETTEDPATVTVDQFGYAEQTTEVSGGATTDFALEPQLAVDLIDGQPGFAETGESVDLTLDVRNLDSLTIDLTDDSGLNASDLTVSVNGTEVELGNETTFDGLSVDAVPVTVEIADDAPTGETFALEHTFAGLGDSVTVVTGPTETVDELQGPEFEVTSIDVQDDVTPEESIFITATVENVGDQTGSTQTITAIQDAATGGEENFIFFPPSDVSNLAPGETQTFETNFGSIAAINAALGTDFGPGDELEAVQQVGSNLDPTASPDPVVEDEATAPFTVIEEGTVFEVSDLDAPESADSGAPIDVSANVTNLGSDAGEQSVDFVFDDAVAASQDVSLDSTETRTVTFEDVELPDADGIFEHGVFTANDSQTAQIAVGDVPTPSVAVVDDSGDFGGAVSDALDAQLPVNYNVSTTTSGAVANGDVDADVVVVQNVEPTAAPGLVDAVEGDSVGAVWLDNWGGGSNGVPARSDVTGDPAETFDGDAVPTPIAYNVQADHPIFDGVAASGESVPIHTGTFGDHAWFNDTDADVLATVAADGGAVTAGDAFAVDEANNTVLASTLGYSAFVNSEDFTAEANAILANSVKYATPEGDGTVQFGQDEYVVGPDETPTLTVETNAENVAGYEIQLEFDPDRIEVESAESANLSGSISRNIDNDNGTVTVAEVAANGVSEPALFELDVTYVGDEGDSASLAFDAEDSEVLNADTETLEVDYSDGTVTSGELGDVNLDGEVDVSDAILIQQHVAEQEPSGEFNLALADVNGDGSVDISDVLAVLDEVTAGNDSTSPGATATEVNGTDAASLAAPPA